MLGANFDPHVFQSWTDEQRREALAVVANACPVLQREHRSRLLADLFAPIAKWWVDAANSASEAANAGAAVSMSGAVSVGDAVSVGMANGGDAADRSRIPLLASASGLPGTGKSTLVAAAKALIQHLYGLRVASFSLDDIYLTREQRVLLAKTVHPLLVQRGVPGTHDVELGLTTVRQLLFADEGTRTVLPRFDKLADDRVPEGDWPIFVGRPDIVLLDGWCFGVLPGDPRDLREPINARERAEDPSGVYRRYVHDQIASYQRLFAYSSAHVHLAAQSLDCSVRFRYEQGRNERLFRGRDPDEIKRDQVERFLALFERVGALPRRAMTELVVYLGEQHEILDIMVRAPVEG